MRFTAVLLTLVLAPAAFAGDPSAKALSPAEAAKKVNEKVTIEMQVKSAGGKGNFFLNSEKDYKSADNFTVFIPKAIADKFKAAKIDDPIAYYKGKTIRVSGTVLLFRDKPEIKIDEPNQIKVVEKK